MQTLRKKTSPCKYRNDPGRFFGDGVTFKAKLIGILEVGEARGDRMCQEALQDLKMAIRAAGEHKQRITIHVTIDGLRLRDEKTSDSLYHHPVHKISFIAQDMSDSRAFGYIFGSPDSGHRFFGIKTDKAASQVVLAMRDLFQVVFELKKKEIELARQHIQSKTIHEHQPVALSIKSSSSPPLTNISHEPSTSKTSHKEMSPESVADLVDLEQELSSIQRGITQMERITPNEPTAKSNDDPFGDSFTHFPTYNLLPPPESSKSRHSKALKPPEDSKPTVTSQSSISASTVCTAKTLPSDDWLTKSSTTNTVAVSSLEEQIKQPVDDSQSNDFGESPSVLEQHIDAFTDLDPLGTGKSRPYIDKKYFFQDLKNPRKKVLKDLSEPEIGFSANFTSLASDGGSSEEQSCKDTITNLEASSLLEVGKKSAESNSGLGGVADFAANFTKTDTFPMSQQSIFKMDLDKHKTDDPIIGNNKALLVTDNDPFSPRMKKFDPFEDDFSKSPLDPFEFNFVTKGKSTVLPETKIVSDDVAKIHIDKRITDFNGPLQVNLPPESYSAYMTHKSVERHSSDASDSSLARNRPNVFKQNTVDVISSISSKKMKPHLFSQKYSKRDSNSINMRRLQESDSLSENETAPEPPPRPDSSSHAEPPPLPPKKQFSDIVIRPSPLSINRDTTRYDYISQNRRNQQNDQNSPALPLPSRKVTRTDSSFPGPGRPAKKVKDEDEYLTPISAKNDLPILLPPPQRGSTKNRGRRHPEPLTATTSNSNKKPDKSIDISLPDITLTQLLTLGIDDLAAKLNVPANKLSTMNIVELTQYLSEFVEKSSQKSIPIADPPVQPIQSEALFKVSFDDSNDATFVAKFDDNFGDDSNGFVPNFDNFDEKVAAAQTNNSSAVDRYAVFRIMDQELKSQEDDEPQNDNTSSFSDNDSNEDPVVPAPVAPIPRIDTKITQAISQAKDRYAALRDIILVEDLFDKPTPLALQKQDDDECELADNSVINDDSDNKVTDNESSPEINISINLDEENDALTDLKPSPILGSKDDLEIDEYMNRAISNLSLDSRDHLSPSISKSPVTKSQNASTSPIRLQKQQQLLSQVTQRAPSLNDMSTSPIPVQKSPVSMEMMPKSPLSQPAADGLSNNANSTSRSPIPMAQGVANLLESVKPVSVGDAAFESSPEVSKTDAQPVVAESWAVFDTITEPVKDNLVKSPKQQNEATKEHPVDSCSSDEKNEWKTEQEYHKRWPRGHTSSSSRDLSPWDDDGQQQSERGRRGLHPDRHGFYMRHARRMHSGDDDYEYEEEMTKNHRDKRSKNSASRNRDNFDTGEANWYHPNNHHSWSPQDDGENGERGGGRSFERSSYERSTYGPPYEKRESYDYRKDYKMYDKKKYYRDYDRPSYDFDEYDDYDPRAKSRKDYDEFEPGFKRPSHRNSKEYFYKVDKRSFDRESCESYDSASRRRKSFGSGDMYGSADSREDFRERYTSAEKIRGIRKAAKQRSNEEYEQDSEGDVVLRRAPGDTRSLQRPALSRPRKSSGSSPWDGEELTPTSSQKSWKRPASASESERRLAESRRALTHTLPGSDGEKDRRFRKKMRSRGKDLPIDGRANSYASTTMRYPPAHRSSELEYEVADYENEPNYRMSRRKQEALRTMTAERRKKDSSFSFDRNMESMHKFSKSSRDVYYPDDQYVDDAPKSARSSRNEYEYDDYEETPRSTNSGKFTFDDEQGFESDFNSPSNGKSLRFSNDFSEKETPRLNTHSVQKSVTPNADVTPTISQKLRFDDKITVSKFDLFEDDDFSKAEFSFENEDQWVAELPKKNLKTTAKRQDNIKKSESVNIFAKKQEDPFEDDDFFAETNAETNNNKNKNGAGNGQFNWERNFAKFDENI